MKADTELLGPATDLRATLVSESLSLLEEYGQDAVTFRELGKRAKASHSAPLVHFGDRTGLLAAMAARGFGLLLEGLREVPAEGAGRVRLEALARAYVGFALERRALHRVMHAPELWAAVEEQELPLDSPAAGKKGQVAAWIAEARKGRDRCFAEFRQAAERAHREGHLAGASPVLLARTVTALADGYILQTTDERVGGGRSVAQLVAEFGGMIRGLGG